MSTLFFIIPLFLCYSILILYYWLSWKSIPDYVPASIPPTTTLSIIIPARNEEDNIGKILTSLTEQKYPKDLYEIIVVNDHSTDATAAIVRQFAHVKLLQLTDEGINSYKKKAIETGIAAATGELIITTDADCLPSPNWLATVASFAHQKQAVFIAAPVVFNHNNSVLQLFQAMDFMVLQGITGAAVHNQHLSMCNGANMAYERNAFYAVNGFAGIDHIASGDDMLLMHKIATKFPDRIHYLKSNEAIVSTEPMKTWKAFFNQRIRWASKAGKYDDKRIIAVLLLVYLFNLSFLGLLIAGGWTAQYWLYAGLLWIAKTLVELPFIYSVAAFFNKKSIINYFFFFQPLHIGYTIISGFLGQFGKYEWKGRNVK
jgi:biofilm PGA synthesis N-glycosyltransferase PgaC